MPTPKRSRPRPAARRAKKPAGATRAARAARPRRRAGAHAPASAPPLGADAGSGLAPGMQSINVYLAVANVAASIEFLEKAFGFSRGVILGEPDGQPRYAEMRHADSVVMLVRKGDPTTATGGVPALYAYVDDVDRRSGVARDAGAGVEPAEDKPWGDRIATITDPDGYRWVLATFKKLAPFT